MLVVDRHALVAVDLLHLFDEVLLGLADALDVEELLRVLRAFDERIARLDLLAVGDLEVRTVGDREVLLRAVVHDDRHAPGGVFLFDADDTRRPGEDRGTLWRAGLEELDDAGKAVGDVLTDDATGVEGTHRELGSRLTDRLGGDDADRLAELDELAGREALAVAGRTDSVRRLTRQHRADPDPRRSSGPRRAGCTRRRSASCPPGARCRRSA